MMKGKDKMESKKEQSKENKKVALIGMMIQDSNAAEKVNEILHDFSEYIVGRMGIPYRERNVNIISIVIDAPENKISALSGKLGMLQGVTVKSVQAPNL